MNKETRGDYESSEDYPSKKIKCKENTDDFVHGDELMKIKAVMIGHAVGDALGVPVEFCSRKELRRNPVTDMRGFGTYPVPAGAWSDDTSMSLCALEALCNKDWSFEMIMDNFVRWIENGEFTPTGESFDVGRTCLDAIIRYRRDSIPAKECGCDGEYSNGNGSLMRIHPFVLYGEYKSLNGTDDGHLPWMDLIKQASELTHAHDRSVMGCYIYAYVLSFLLKEPSRESILAGIRAAGENLGRLPELENYKRIFNPDFALLPEGEIKSSGYVVDTLEAALWCLLTTDNYRDCVLKAVNLGSDTDSVAAVAGGLAGALYGYDSIPQKWRDTLLRNEYIEELCECACVLW